MQRVSVFLILALWFVTVHTAIAASKPQVIAFGKWSTVKIAQGESQRPRDVKVRPIFVDSRIKEYSTGNPHDVTDRLFVVRRVFRLNDALPQESANHWQWQWGEWLVIDRVTGRISQLNLPDFDSPSSEASWYRDYVAYCGLSEDGKKLLAVVARVGSRKPVLKKALGEPADADAPASGCPAPNWQRNPGRVTFQPEQGQSLSFSIRGRVVDVASDSGEEAEE